MVGAAAAVEFLASLSSEDSRRDRLVTAFAEMHSRNAALFEILWNGLQSNPRVTVYGPPPAAARTPTVSFTISGVRSSDAARQLAQKGLFLSHGDFYAATVVQRLGLDEEGLIRAGCACYTTKEEIERLVRGVEEICS